MHTVMQPNADQFAADPFGYSALAWHKWGMIRTANGFPVDISIPPTAHDLKDPILWLAHANALSEAAVCLVKNAPIMASFPSEMRTISHSQYYAVALMLVGYSLEVCLKTMLLLKLGVDEFMASEKDYFHHDLNELSSFILDLSEKDRAILKGLSHFVKWAGRYPDPGSKRVDNAVDVFKIAETHQITAKEIFGLSGRIMKYTQVVIG